MIVSDLLGSFTCCTSADDRMSWVAPPVVLKHARATNVGSPRFRLTSAPSVRAVARPQDDLKLAGWFTASGMLPQVHLGDSELRAPSQAKAGHHVVFVLIVRSMSSIPLTEPKRPGYYARSIWYFCGLPSTSNRSRNDTIRYRWPFTTSSPSSGHRFRFSVRSRFSYIYQMGFMASFLFMLLTLGSEVSADHVAAPKLPIFSLMSMVPLPLHLIATNLSCTNRTEALDCVDAANEPSHDGGFFSVLSRSMVVPVGRAALMRVLDTALASTNAMSSISMLLGFGWKGEELGTDRVDDSDVYGQSDILGVKPKSALAPVVPIGRSSDMSQV
ncbi:uncharacterized protein STEHIDRAFT_115848 [Stereum hirsutum FP-91666 SS1]|uniref:Uncharacterized protein n=1 Tax=Stereum hirsutum (strain FP-91666) TaxID=721885 RepID=R7S1F0_STEHR|nr:uncharacterized protein STEHIDRAFT_115848 [Stereum hirsutum FP-91666 SS1]EIM80397.1 hypothetical protein STEHIDRAFT_115848 [Stereum hirsutum FP-91666 SS1]